MNGEARLTELSKGVATWTEETSVCAFFDVLGTRSIMLGDDVERRRALIEMVRNLARKCTNYSANATNFAGAIVMTPAAQSTAFSDNVAVSFPIRRLCLPGRVGNAPLTFYLEASQFLNNMLIQVVNAVWDGLKIGVLMRGGIAVGRLVHDQEIVVGEALVRAVELEKATEMPRIEVSSELMDMKDDQGRPVIEPYLLDECFLRDGDRWFVRTLRFHVGYWRDHNYFRKREGKAPEHVREPITRIRETLEAEFGMVKLAGGKKEIAKWSWFMAEFEREIGSGHWVTELSERTAKGPVDSDESSSGS